MGQLFRDALERRLLEVEGYLELGLPEKALAVLASRADWATMQFEASYLTGETLRALGRHREALRPLETAAALRPDDLRVAMAQGWCYKRSNRLAQAIDALVRARRHHPDHALVHFNLACYWALAGHRPGALDSLRMALQRDPSLARRVADEADFLLLRGDPDFDRLVPDRVPGA